MAAAVATRRLPGVASSRSRRRRARVLPRMDVAAFVGFAASGPLHVPVAVEDAAQFAALFGGDAPLAWDAERGEHGARAARAGGARVLPQRRPARAGSCASRPDAAQRSVLPLPGLVERAAGRRAAGRHGCRRARARQLGRRAARRRARCERACACWRRGIAAALAFDARGRRRTRSRRATCCGSAATASTLLVVARAVAVGAGAAARSTPPLPGARC